MPNAPIELSERALKEQLEKNLKAILLDCEKYNLKVGIPAYEYNASKTQVYTNKKGIKKRRSVDVAHNVNVAQYAAKNEFGSFSEHIPSRPFMRTTFIGDSMKQIQKTAQRIFTEVAETNRGAKEALEKLGLFIAGAIQRNIVKGNFKPNSPVTIARKGSSKPLIDTGTMRRAISAWVTGRI
jgi:hypothetical protein